MKILLLIGASAFLLSGCAGLATGFINNPAAGTYDGTFTESNGHSGTANLTLTKLGNVFGTLDDKTVNQTANMSGSVDKNLFFKGDIQYPGTARYNVSGTFGQVSGDKTVKGTLTGSSYSITFDLARP